MDIRADIYSLGCTLYFLLTGRPPFGDCPTVQKLSKHQHEPPPLKSQRAGVPDEVVAVLDRMIAKKTVQRYQTPAEVAEALRAILSRGIVCLDAPPEEPTITAPSEAPDTVGAWPTTQPEGRVLQKPISHPSRRSWLGWGLLVAGLLGTSAALGFRFLRRKAVGGGGRN